MMFVNLEDIKQQSIRQSSNTSMIPHFIIWAFHYLITPGSFDFKLTHKQDGAKLPLKVNDLFYITF